MVTKVDRLSRSTTHLWELVETLEANEVALRFLTASEARLCTIKAPVSDWFSIRIGGNSGDVREA